MDRLRTFILATLLATAADAFAEIVVIVNPDNETTGLSRRQLIDLYMGRYQNFPNGEAALPLDQAPDSPIRKLFYKAMVDKSVAEVNAYWARLLFTGRASPPRVMAGSAEILKAVRDNRGAIGYIESSELDGSVKVVTHVE